MENDDISIIESKEQQAVDEYCNLTAARPAGNFADGILLCAEVGSMMSKVSSRV